VDDAFRQPDPSLTSALIPPENKPPREVVPIDGKTMRRSHDRSEERPAQHVVSAWASELGVSLGQLAVPEKTNEITAIPELVRMLVLVNCIVTIDAMGCQKEIARTIREGRADYILAVKGNQPTLATSIAQFFEDMEHHESDGITFEDHETLERKRGRREQRMYWLAPAPVSLTASGEWKDLRTIGMVTSECAIGDKTTQETRYYISSISKDVTEFSRAVRAHWSIENSLHWRLDVVFREDDSRQRIGHSARAFSQFRRIALSLLNRETSTKKSLRSKRKKAARDSNYLLKVLAGV
jgi:predicted transposase YbfD/YdcC